MASDNSSNLAKLEERLAQKEAEAAQLRARLNAVKTRERNGQLMAWGEALEAAYLTATDEGQRSNIEAMILGALKGEGARVKMWRKRAAEGFARLKGGASPAAPEKPEKLTPEEKPQQPVAVEKSHTSSQVVELRCPIRDKELAKERGARWNPDKALWYVPPNTDLRPFAQWMKEEDKHYL